MPQNCGSTITLLPLCGDRRYMDRNMEEFRLHFSKMEILSHTSLMFPSQSCHVYKSSCHQRIDPPLTWSVLCVEHLGRTKPRSACAGLWRPSFCVHYLLFMYIPLLWFVARETLCRKCSRSHVHREGKHISTAVAKTVHACTHTLLQHTHAYTHTSLPQKCTPPTQRCPPPSVTTIRARFRDTGFLQLWVCLTFSSSSFSPIFLFR